MDWPNDLYEQVEMCSFFFKKHLSSLHLRKTGSVLEADMSEVRSSIWFMAWFVQFSDLELIDLVPEFADWIRGVSKESRTMGSLSDFVREIWSHCNTHRKASLDEVFSTVSSVCRWLLDEGNLGSSLGTVPIRTPGPPRGQRRLPNSRAHDTRTEKIGSRCLRPGYIICVRPITAGGRSVESLISDH